MENFKISVDVNVKLSDETIKFFASVFSGTCTANNNISVPMREGATNSSGIEKPAPAAPAVVAPAKPAPAVTTDNTDDAKSDTDKAPISIDDVRAAVASKVTNYRKEIKEKLTELGAPSVTKLDSSKYEEMLNFLNSLE